MLHVCMLPVCVCMSVCMHAYVLVYLIYLFTKRNEVESCSWLKDVKDIHMKTELGNDNHTISNI